MDQRPPFNNPHLNQYGNFEIPSQFNSGWHSQDPIHSEYTSQPQFQNQIYPEYTPQFQIPFSHPYTSQFQNPSQQPPYTPQFQNSSQPSQSQPPSKKKGGNWSEEEDIALCKAWIMIGEDPVTGTDQSMGTLWQRIQRHWVRQLGDKITEERSHGALMNRFSNFQRDVNKFSGYYKNVHDNPISGYNEYDMMNAVRELYKLQQKKKIKYEHCWNVLRHSEKWQMHCNVNENPTRRPMKRGVDLDINEPRNWSESTPTTPGSSTPTVSTPGSINLGDDDTPVDTEGSNMSRPEGQKARKIRKKKTPSLEASILKQLEAVTAQGVMFGEAGVEGERMRLQLSMEKQRTKQLAIESNLEKERTKQLEIKTRERMAEMEFERDIMRQDPSKAPTEAAKAWIIQQQNLILNKLNEGGGHM